MWALLCLHFERYLLYDVSDISLLLLFAPIVVLHAAQDSSHLLLCAIVLVQVVHVTQVSHFLV